MEEEPLLLVSPVSDPVSLVPLPCLLSYIVTLTNPLTWTHNLKQHTQLGCYHHHTQRRRPLSMVNKHRNNSIIKQTSGMSSLVMLLIIYGTTCDCMDDHLVHSEPVHPLQSCHTQLILWCVNNQNQNSFIMGY